MASYRPGTAAKDQLPPLKYDEWPVTAPELRRMAGYRPGTVSNWPVTSPGAALKRYRVWSVLPYCLPVSMWFVGYLGIVLLNRDTSNASQDEWERTPTIRETNHIIFSVDCTATHTYQCS